MTQVLKEGDIINARLQNYPSRQFKLIKSLGEGCEGQVFQAQSINWNSNQSYALKIHFDSERPEYIQFIENIITYQNQYESNDQNCIPSQIIRIYDKFEYKHPKTQKKYLIVVMELSQQELYSLIKQLNKTNLQYIQQILFYVTKSVQFLHINKMFHRDLKPENFIQVGQQIKLIDFGFIKYQIDNVRQTPNVGSIVFQAPEVIQGNSDYSQAIDIWSLACVFYEVLTSKQLIQYKSRVEYQSYIRNKPQQLQKDLHDTISKLGIPETWKTIIKKMLSIDPKNRPQINEVLKIFENFEKQADIQPTNQLSINQQLINQLSINQQPMNQQPIYQQSINQQSINKQSINQQPINQQSINQLSINQQSIYQQPINQYTNYEPNKVGFKLEKLSMSQLPYEQGPQVDQRVFQSDVQYSQYNQNVSKLDSQNQQQKIIEEKIPRQNFSIISNIIMLKLQIKSYDDVQKNTQIFQDFNNDFKELNQSIQNQDQSLQKLKSQQIKQQEIIEIYQSELKEIQNQEAIIKEINQKIYNLQNQLKNKQDLNSQIQIQKINFQLLKDIEIQFETQQFLQSIMDDLKKFNDLHQKLGEQIITEKSLIQQEIQQLIVQIKQLENQIQSERVVVDNCNKDIRNLEIETNTNKLNNMKQTLTKKFEKYKDSLFNILNIIQSNQIKIGKLDLLQKNIESQENKY